MLMLEKFSFGMGDRFAHQATAQLQACILAAQGGAEIVPVWNKSNREHTIVGSEPPSVRQAAQAAVQSLGWKGRWYVDADHINLTNVDRFLSSSNFFTIDVASYIGQPTPSEAVRDFLDKHAELVGQLEIPGIDSPFDISQAQAEVIAGKYLLAVQEAGRIYRYIAERQGPGNFVTEVSMDETDRPQTPPELLLILVALADAGVPLQTIAPKFTGRFNKGVDYVGDLQQFEREFNEDLAVIAFAVRHYGLPSNLKLSVHSGSDKFSIYGPIRRALERTGAGLHLKTAGTTWLEELIGLAEGGAEGLDLAKSIYVEALEHLEELCLPYATVIDIDPAKLPPAAEIRAWSSEQFVSALRHDPKNPQFNPHLRQLLHVGYKIAAKKGARYLDALQQFEGSVARNVTTNLFERHLKPLFL